MSGLVILLFVFSVISRPADCIFPYDFNEAVRKKVSAYPDVNLSVLALIHKLQL